MAISRDLIVTKVTQWYGIFKESYVIDSEEKKIFAFGVRRFCKFVNANILELTADPTKAELAALLDQWKEDVKGFFQNPTERDKYFLNGTRRAYRFILEKAQNELSD